jgi:para-nitrobenzyl esterase
MRSAPVFALLHAAEKVPSIDSTVLNVSFGAYVDGDLLPQQPEGAITTGSWNKVPVLIGSNHDEAGTTTFGVLKLKQVQENHADETQTEQYWPLSQHTYHTILATKYKDNAPLVSAAYAGLDYPTPFDALSSILTDSYVLGCGISPQADIFALNTSTFRYEFSDPNTPLPQQVEAAAGRSLGAYHAGELQYLFRETGYPGPQSAEQQALSDRMIQHWANFVKTGDPANGTNSPWPRYQAGDRSLLVLSPQGDSVANNFDTEHHCQLWKSLLFTPSSDVNAFH